MSQIIREETFFKQKKNKKGKYTNLGHVDLQIARVNENIESNYNENWTANISERQIRQKMWQLSQKT